MQLIKTENLIKNYQSINVLRQINITIEQGEFVGIMGKSGSGKSTLLKILGMIETLSGGTVFYKGKNIEKMNNNESARIRREEFGFVFQEFFLMESLNVLENVMLPFFISRRADSAGKEKARDLLEKFEIRKLENKMPNELSGGEKQRVAICRALVNDPQIIFADEPTGNLDSKSGKIVIDALRKINRDFGKTIIMVTHDPQMASYCERILLLKDGEILEELKKEKNYETFYDEIIKKMICL